MIQSISIQNFKSVVDLKLDLGRFNVLIGENGCGKSNILEGIAFGSAALSDKLEREYFINRGIRFSDPSFIYSAFEYNQKHTYINIDIEAEHFNKKLKLFFNSDLKFPKWDIFTDLESEDQLKYIEKNYKDLIGIEYSKISKVIEDLNIKTSTLSNRLNLLESNKTINTNSKNNKECINKEYLDIKKILDQYNIFFKRIKSQSNILKKELNKEYEYFSNYLIFALEETVLRRFDTENAIHPLGRNGEGLFSYLKEISQKENGIDILNEIKSNLDVLDWFDNLEIPKDQLSNEFSLQIKDKYINDTLHFFDQRSTNEGFLYLLFYLTLFISDETPSFFAIDNLEASFNPKLCREVTRRLIQLAKKHNKQVIVTTHSPAILDGLDITNNDERLFVVRRNIDGYTKVNRVEYKTTTNLALSEAWLKGYIGGLPENF